MKKLIAMTLAGAVAIPLLVGSSPASAGSDGTSRILGIAGSDTTTFVIDALASAHNTNARYNPDFDKVINIPPLHSTNASVQAGEATLASVSWLASARRTWPGGQVMPADLDCTTQYVFGGTGSIDANTDGDVSDGGDRAFTTVDIDLNNNSIAGEVTVPGEKVRLGVIAPNGSGAGQSAARNATAYPAGCLDMVRSSSAPSSGNQPSFETWAFALDAVGWTYFPGNTHGVTLLGLTQAQLKNAYTCSATNLDANNDGDFTDVGDRRAGYPIFSKWGDITGNTSDLTPIRAYRVQPGSGTGTDVARTILGLADNNDSTVLANCDGFNNIDMDTNPATSFAFPIVQEHDCRSVADVDKVDAICFYGFSRWQIQARALEADKRNGTVFGKFAISGTPKRPSFSNINELASRFEGTRYVYSLVVRNQTGTGGDVLPGIEDSRRFVGVSKQPVACNVPAATVNETVVGADCNFDGDTLDTSVPVGGVPGFVCGSLDARKIIRTYGMKPLASGITDSADADYGQSFCRRNKYSL